MYIAVAFFNASLRAPNLKTFFSFALGSINLNIAGYRQDMGDLKALLKNATAIYIF